MKESLGRDVEFKIIQVEELTIEPNGKFRVSYSMVESEYDSMNWEKEFFIKNKEVN
jgi:hypothetical protein